MSEFINTRDTMPGSTDEERAQQTLDALVAHQLTDFKEDNIMYIRSSGLQYNTGLETVEFPNLVYTPGISDSNQRIFLSCTALRDAKFKSLTKIGIGFFQYCKALKSVEFSDSLDYIGGNAFYDSGLEIFDTKSDKPIVIIIDNNGLTYSRIKHLIIRNSICATLASISALSDCLIGRGDGGIYVPSALLDSYKSATNWSAYAANIYPIIYDDNNEIVLKSNFDTIEDSWEDIFAAEEDGTYNTKYSIGDTKSVEIGNEIVKMQIAAFDADTIAGTNDKAKITWICKNLYGNSKQVNFKGKTVGGWPASTIYSDLNNSTDGIYNSIDSTVKTAIKTVVKPYWNAETSTEETSNDKLWLLSSQEVNFINNIYPKENNGVTYNGLFPTASNSSNTNRKKYGSSISPSIWWLRSSYDSSQFMIVDTSGAAYSMYTTNYLGVIFGFCT